MSLSQKFRSFLTKPVNRIEVVIITIILVPFLTAAVSSAATTISTNISTGGTLSVTGTSTFTGNVGVGTNAQDTQKLRLLGDSLFEGGVLIGPTGGDPSIYTESNNYNVIIGDTSGAINNTRLSVDVAGQSIDITGNLTITGTTNGVKVYRALLSQTGTDAPVATVLENSLGGTVVWTWAGTGGYNGTLSGAFPAGKVFPSIRGFVNDDPVNEFTTAYIYRNTSNIITVKTAFFETAGAVGSLANDMLSETPVEILVYP